MNFVISVLAGSSCTVWEMYHGIFGSSLNGWFLASVSLKSWFSGHPFIFFLWFKLTSERSSCGKVKGRGKFGIHLGFRIFLKSRIPVESKIFLRSRTPVGSKIFLRSGIPVGSEIFLKFRIPLRSNIFLRSRIPLTSTIPLGSRFLLKLKIPLRSLHASWNLQFRWDLEFPSNQGYPRNSVHGKESP